MYFRERESARGNTLGAAAAAAAAPVAIGAGITIGTVLTAIALVVTAIAVAYGLIKAYEAAQERGFGVELAKRMLSAGLGRLINFGRRVVRLGELWLAWLKRILKPHPQCAGMIAALAAVLADLIRIMAELEAERRREVPRIPELNRLMAELRHAIDRFTTLLKITVRVCLKYHGPELLPGSVNRAMIAPVPVRTSAERGGDELMHVRRRRERN